MPIPIRNDFDAIAVRSAARQSKDGAQARRLLAVAAEGKRQLQSMHNNKRHPIDICANPWTATLRPSQPL